MTNPGLIAFALDEIIAHLGTCVTQRAPSDDAIIADHIVCALAHAKAARDALDYEPPDPMRGVEFPFAENH